MPPPGGQPPPPPSGQPVYSPPPPSAPPPPAGQWGPPPPAGAPGGGYGAPAGGYPSPSGASFDPKAVNPLDWGILAVGLLTLIFSFFSYYTVTFSLPGFNYGGNENAWNGFFGWFAVFLALLGAVAVAVELFAPQVKAPVPTRLVALGLFALALICVLLALVIFPESVPSGVGISTGRGFGYWADLALVVVGAVLCFLRLRATGTALPWEKRSVGTPPGGFGTPPSGFGTPPGGYGNPGGYAPPSPPPGYGPPPGGPAAPGGYAPPSPPPGYGPPPAGPSAPGEPGMPPPPPGSYGPPS